MLNEAVLFLSGTLFNFVARINQRRVGCDPLMVSRKSERGFKKYPQNVFSGKIVELLLLKGTRVTNHILCFVDRASLYNLVNKVNLVYIFIMFIF